MLNNNKDVEYNCINTTLLILYSLYLVKNVFKKLFKIFFL